MLISGISCECRGTHSLCSCSRRAVAMALYSSRMRMLLVVMVSSNLARILRYLRLVQSAWCFVGRHWERAYLHDRLTGGFSAPSGASGFAVCNWPSSGAGVSEAMGEEQSRRAMRLRTDGVVGDA
jgi:hypothetical protein